MTLRSAKKQAQLRQTFVRVLSLVLAVLIVAGTLASLINFS